MDGLAAWKLHILACADYFRARVHHKAKSTQYCGEEVDTAQHTLEKCPAWDALRRVLTGVIGEDLSLPAVVSKMVGSVEAWNAVASFCEQVMQKEAAERAREEDPLAAPIRKKRKRRRRQEFARQQQWLATSFPFTSSLQREGCGSTSLSDQCRPRRATRVWSPLSVARARCMSVLGRFHRPKYRGSAHIFRQTHSTRGDFRWCSEEFPKVSQCAGKGQHGVLVGILDIAHRGGKQ